MLRLLQAVVVHRAKLVFIDLTSVEELDQAGADCVRRLVRALGLLGTRAVLTGLRSQVALRLSELEFDLSELQSLRSLKDGLWEVRSSLPSQRIARLILCFLDGVLIVLHGFIKKTQKTPTDDLSLAKRRMAEVTK